MARSDKRKNRAIYLYYVEDLTQGEIADKMDLTQPTISEYLNSEDAEEVEDTVSSLVASGSNLSWAYDDANDELTVSLANSIAVDKVTTSKIAADLETITSPSDLTDGEPGFYYVSSDDDTIWFDGDTSTN